MSNGHGAEEKAVAEQIGRNVAGWARIAGPSPQEIAVMASIHRTHLRLIERGERLPQVDTIIRLAGALGVDPTALLNGVVWRPDEERFHIEETPVPNS